MCRSKVKLLASSIVGTSSVVGGFTVVFLALLALRPVEAFHAAFILPIVLAGRSGVGVGLVGSAFAIGLQSVVLWATRGTILQEDVMAYVFATWGVFVLSGLASGIFGSYLSSLRKRATDISHQKAEEDAVLADIGRIIGSSLRIDDVYQQFAECLGEVLPFDRLTIDLIDPKSETFTNTYSSTGPDVPERRAGVRVSLQGSMTGEALRTRSPVLVQGGTPKELTSRYPGLAPGLRAGLRSFLSVPLISKDRVIGILHLRTVRQDAYLKRDLALAGRVGAQIAGAIANAQLYGERMHVEEALRESEEHFRSLYDNTPVMMHTIDREGRLINVNQHWLNTLGYEHTEAIGRRSIEFLTDASRRYASEVALPQFWKIGSARDVEYEMVKKNGEVIDVLLSAVAKRDESGEVTQSLAFLVDVTERKRAEEALVYQAHLLENVHDAVIASDERFVTTAWNRGAEEMYGWTAEEVIGRPTVEFLQPEFVDVEPDEVFRRLSEEGSFEGEVIHPRKDGTMIHTEARAMALRDEDGRMTGFVSIDRDITKRKRAEEEIRRLALAVDTTGEAVIIVGIDSQVSFVNRAAEIMCGYRPGEMLGMSVLRLHAESSDATTALEIFETTMSEGAWTGEIVFQKKTGGEFPVRLSTALMKDEQQRAIGIVGIAADISERKRLEEQFLQAQKMESVGRLASGVAHDFNNLLTAIISFTQLAAMKIPEEEVASDYLQEVQNAAERATSLTSQLLAFSRRQVIETRVLNLNENIMGTHRMLRRLIGEDIELATLMESELGLVKIDPSQIEQVLTNLAVNARDAMPAGGKLVIETANVSLDEEFVTLHPGTTAGEYIMLTVSDNGVGMTKDVQAHIFEPFFTTKEVTRGTGLGLSTCYGIVRQSGGHIEVQSEPEQGTTFRIYLPRVEETTGTLPLRDESGCLPTGSETVLLVEDEPLVREVARHLLREQGYTVLEAANGTEAIRVATERVGETIDLLLTDVVMPLMGGAVLAERVKEIHPESKVLYMSGYIDDAVVQQQLLQNLGAFLQKPFTPAMLACTVRETLDGGSVAV